MSPVSHHQQSSGNKGIIELDMCYLIMFVITLWEIHNSLLTMQGLRKAKNLFWRNFKYLKERSYKYIWKKIMFWTKLHAGFLELPLEKAETSYLFDEVKYLHEQ